jgi:type II secretory pathway pseudopilin PulG
MKSLLRKHYIALLVTAIIVGVALAGFVLLFFLMKKREIRVHEVKQTLATYEQNKKTFSKEIEKMNILNNKLQLLESKKITEASTPNLLSQIETMAASKGVEVSITSVETPDIDGKKKMFVDLSAAGTFAGIKDFTDMMLSQEYKISFSSFSLYKKNAESAEDVHWELLATFEVISF